METQHLSLSLTARESFPPQSKSKNARFPTERRKAITCYSSGSTRSTSQSTQMPTASYCTSLQESHVSPVKELESQLLHGVAICYSAGARRPAPHSAQRPSAPHCDFRSAPAPPPKSRGKRRGTTTRILKGVTYPAYPSLRNTAGAPREKKNKTLKTPTIQHKRLKP
jgi:hypothetical protein